MSVPSDPPLVLTVMVLLLVPDVGIRARWYPQTAAEQGARFFENVVSEHNANPRMLIVHEVMGRHCGWLTAATAKNYCDRMAHKELLPEIGLTGKLRSIHAVFIPEMEIDIAGEAKRLHKVMDENGAVKFPADKLEAVLTNVGRLRDEEAARMGALQNAKSAADVRAIFAGESYAEEE